MKLAYLILCHKNPHQVNLLTQALCQDGNRVFLHWDKKTYQACVPKLQEREGLTILPYEEVVAVSWSDYSICEAEITLCRYAMAEPFDYIFYLSGQDFPLWSQNRIKTYLVKNNGTNFIDILDETNPHRKRFEKRNHLFHWNGLRKSTLLTRFARKIYYLVTGGLTYTFPLWRRNSSLVLYYGSNWWCLRWECLEELLSIYDDTPDLKRFFQGSICSDECLFQSLFMQSSYRGTNQPNLTYIDWSEHKSSPKTFSIADKEVLLCQPKKCFARKFDAQKDEKILQILQEAINGTN